MLRSISPADRLYCVFFVSHSVPPPHHRRAFLGRLIRVKAAYSHRFFPAHKIGLALTRISRPRQFACGVEGADATVDFIPFGNLTLDLGKPTSAAVPSADYSSFSS